jgi:hypothetical protein
MVRRCSPVLIAGWLALVVASSPRQSAFTPPETEQVGQEDLGIDAQPGSSGAALAAADVADAGEVDSSDPSDRLAAPRTLSRRRDIGRRTPQPDSEAPAAPPRASRRQDRGSSQRTGSATEEPERASLGAGYRSALRRAQKAHPPGEERWVEQQAVGELPLFGASQRSVLLLATWLLAPLLGCVLVLLGVRMAGLVLEDGARPLLGAKRGRRGLIPPTGTTGGAPLAARELLRVLLVVWPECTRCFIFRRRGPLASQADTEMGSFEPLGSGGVAGGGSGGSSGSSGSGVDGIGGGGGGGGSGGGGDSSEGGGGGGGGGGDGASAGAPSAASAVAGAPAPAPPPQSPSVTRRSLSGRTGGASAGGASTGGTSPQGGRPPPLRLRPGTATPSRSSGLPEIFGSETDPACLLTDAQRRLLIPFLPVQLQMHDWMLRYSTEQHGCSLRTAMAKVADRGGSLLVVRDVDGHVFGGFASTPWHVSPHYFGTGECFLFSASPAFRCWPWTGPPPRPRPPPSNPPSPAPPPSTLHPPPSTLHPPPSTLHPPPSTLHPPPSTLHPPPSTLHRSLAPSAPAPPPAL